MYHARLAWHTCPAFFARKLRRLPKIGYRVTCQPSDEILIALEANDQDIGVLCPPSRLQTPSV